jgi:glycine oxidase
VRTYDIAIIGGGIIGVSIAFELAAEKLNVIVVDRKEPGREASWAAAGMLSPASESAHDLPLVPFACESLRLYPQFIEAIESVSGKRTNYARDGALEVFLSADAERECDERLSGLRGIGDGVERITGAAARQMDRAISASIRAALWIPGEGTVEPRLLMDALLTAARNRGVEIRAGCGVTGLIQQGDHSTALIAGGEKIVAQHVVLAAGCFSGEIVNDSWLKHLAPTRPVRGQMMAFRPNREAPGVRRVTRSNHGYLVPRADGRIVAGSTVEEAGFDELVTAAGLTKILQSALAICPELGDAEVIETWAGLRPGTPDDLPILGPADREGLWIATGHYRNGILLAAATANLFRNWIVRANPGIDVAAFSPSRFARQETRAQAAV